MFKVKAIVGDTHLGGKNFDSSMVANFEREFGCKHMRDVSKHLRAPRRLQTACEKVKRQLSSAMQSAIEVNSQNGGMEFYSSITPAKLKYITMDLFLCGVIARGKGAVRLEGFQVGRG